MNLNKITKFKTLDDEESFMIDLKRVNRLEVIDQQGRVFVHSRKTNTYLEFAFQDNCETLKIFIKDK